MIYRVFFLFCFISLHSCIEYPIKTKDDITKKKDYFISRGFTLIYTSDLLSNKLVNKKIEERELLIFQKNLKKNTKVKITNLINNRSILATVGPKAIYPTFYNSVISKRIATELNIQKDEPYIQINELIENSSFIAKVTKTFEEEKNVAEKVPVDEIKISDLSNSVKTPKKHKEDKKDFNYIIKIADLYFNDSAKSLVLRIKNETLIKEVFIIKLSKSKYRVFLGPFQNITLLQKAFNDIKILKFENIEIIHNDK